MYIVMCRVSGGVTGTRQVPLKANGAVIEFGARQYAQEAADRLQRDVAENSNRTADFQYWVEERT